MLICKSSRQVTIDDSYYWKLWKKDCSNLDSLCYFKNKIKRTYQKLDSIKTSRWKCGFWTSYKGRQMQCLPCYSPTYSSFLRAYSRKWVCVNVVQVFPVKLLFNLTFQLPSWNNEYWNLETSKESPFFHIWKHNFIRLSLDINGKYFL